MAANATGGRLMRRAELPDHSLWEIAEAGGPILADESVADVLPLPKQLVGEGTFLMRRVTGESMIDAAITGGDWVVVRRDSEVENGDIVAALVESETGREVT